MWVYLVTGGGRLLVESLMDMGSGWWNLHSMLGVVDT